MVGCSVICLLYSMDYYETNFDYIMTDSIEEINDDDDTIAEAVTYDSLPPPDTQTRRRSAALIPNLQPPTDAQTRIIRKRVR